MIISLTTIPERIQHIKPVIESLISQTQPPEKILLWVPNDVEYEIPTFLNTDIVEIKRCKDIGPATKFIYTINELKPNQEFIVVDDDTIYSEFLIESLAKFPEIDAPKCVKGIHYQTGKPVRRRLMTEVDGSLKTKFLANKFSIGLTDIMLGADGYILKPKYFDKNINNIPKEFRRYDDVWLGAYFDAYNIKKYVVPCRCLSYAQEKANIANTLKTEKVEWVISLLNKIAKPHLRYIDDIHPIGGGTSIEHSYYLKVKKYILERMK
tara:strand:- start:8178 stop:8975 length:798 start_codon:yes stop_codon:yes gene_type:complete